MQNIIPKIIHYCWISGDPYPPEVLSCMESWKRNMPDYKLILWDKKKCEGLNIPFINDAIKLKKYAFAADVVRVVALYQYGGIYLDTDVFIKKNLNPLLNNEFVSFLEVYPYRLELGIRRIQIGNVTKVKGIGIQAAVMASKYFHPFLLDILNYYSKQRLLPENIKFHMKFIAPDIQASLLQQYGFKYIDEMQLLKNNITIYPSNFIGTNKNLDNSESYGIHLCLGSWVPKKNIISKVYYYFHRVIYLILKYFRII